MTTFVCDCTECRYNNAFEGRCTKDRLSIADFNDADDENAPACFESYRDREDYQEEYWITCKERGIIHRERRKGKKIEINGLVLYTQDRMPPTEVCLKHADLTDGIFCTEEKTGYAVGLRAAIQHTEEIVKFIQKNPSVMDYPEIGAKDATD